VLTVAGAAAGEAATVSVGSCSVPGTVHFTTIQAAVNAAPAGSTIKVCPGTYPEQVIISKALTITAVSGAPTIVPPAGGLVANASSYSSGNPIAAQVKVIDATGPVNITKLTVDGAGNGIAGCAPNIIGFLYQNSSGKLTSVVARNQKLAAGLEGCQSGVGIFVQSDRIGGVSNVTVISSSVHDFQKTGIAGNEVGTTLTATTNVVIGQGPTTGAAENGIQIGFGATGAVTGNKVIDNIWAPDTSSDPGDGAAGILIYGASPTTVTSNIVGNTQFGIAVVSDPSFLADTSTVTKNTVMGTRIFDGIDICSNSNTVQNNTVYASQEAGIHLDASCVGTGNNNLVTNNTITEACAGILNDPGTNNNTTAPNTYNDVTTTVKTGPTCTTGFAPAHMKQAQKPAPTPVRP
jgi:nitrous oxidase accessory protein NosD